jgi:hypothetical protein
MIPGLWVCSPPVLKGGRVAQSLVFCMVFCPLLPFSFDHCIVCPSSEYASTWPFCVFGLFLGAFL